MDAVNKYLLNSLVSYFNALTNLDTYPMEK